MTEKINDSEKETSLSQMPDYAMEIVATVRSNLAPARVRERVLEYHENDIASALEILKKDERLKLYSILDALTLANVFEYTGRLSEYITELNIRKRVEIFSHLEITSAIECLQAMEKPDRNTLIELMDDDVRREIILFSSFDDGEIGSRMTTNFVSIPTGITVRQAMRELIAQAAENDNISTIYVTDSNGTFVGAIELKDLIIARENVELESIIMTSYPYVYATELIEECIERIKGYSEDSIPVLDNDNKLKGVLTSQDVTELAVDILGDDYAKLAGLTAEEDLYEPLRKSVSKRFPWLIVLLGLGLVVSGVVGAFENVISSLSIIVSFQSLILGMAGNVGTQSLAVTIRVLMDERVNAKQKLFLVWKEARTGLLLGTLLGTLSFAVIGLYLAFVKQNPVPLSFSVSLCTGIALALSMLLSSISGTTVPLIFKKLKIDPAVASGPLITTINDLVAVISYYGLAYLLLL